MWPQILLLQIIEKTDFKKSGYRSNALIWQDCESCLGTWKINYSFLTEKAREGNGTPLHYSCLENPMDGGAWWAAVHGVAKSRTWLSDFTFTFHFHALEKEMATHSSVLDWRIPGKAEPGGQPSMGSHRVPTRLKRLSSSSNSKGKITLRLKIDRKDYYGCLVEIPNC